MPAFTAKAASLEQVITFVETYAKLVLGESPDDQVRIATEEITKLVTTGLRDAESFHTQFPDDLIVEYENRHEIKCGIWDQTLFSVTPDETGVYDLLLDGIGALKESAIAAAKTAGLAQCEWSGHWWRNEFVE